MNRNLVILGATILLSISARTFAADAPLSTAGYDQDVPRKQRNLENQTAPGDHQRLSRNLNDQTNQAYPDREKIEERRKQMRERMREKLQRADQNGDGSISRSEAERDLPGMARHFDQIDGNHDGILSREELSAAREKIRGQRMNQKP